MLRYVILVKENLNIHDYTEEELPKAEYDSCTDPNDDTDPDDDSGDSVTDERYIKATDH